MASNKWSSLIRFDHLLEAIIINFEKYDCKLNSYEY